MIPHQANHLSEESILFFWRGKRTSCAALAASTLDRMEKWRHGVCWNDKTLGVCCKCCVDWTHPNILWSSRHLASYEMFSKFLALPFPRSALMHLCLSFIAVFFFFFNVGSIKTKQQKKTQPEKTLFFPPKKRATVYSWCGTAYAYNDVQKLYIIYTILGFLIDHSPFLLRRLF